MMQRRTRTPRVNVHALLAMDRYESGAARGASLVAETACRSVNAFATFVPSYSFSRQLTFDAEMKGYRQHKSDDAIHWMVHFVRALLARGIVCTDFASDRLAFISAL